MKRLIIEFREADGLISTEIQYMDGYERFNRLEIIGLVSSLLSKINLEIDKSQKKSKKTTK